jgi:hypothetical protein
MKDDYLWDRSGKPDPEIQQLEEILGTMRYQPRALEIPAQVSPDRRRGFFPRMAIAAALAATLVGAAAWFLLQNPSTGGNLESASGSGTTQKLKTPDEKVDSPANETLVVQSTTIGKRRENKSNRRGSRSSMKAANKQPRVINSPHNQLTASDRAGAAAAKEQLILALRVASSKLNLAQRKAQGAYPSNLIRNQHKVG